MEIMTISEVSRNFNVSTRMLHYYEKVGLISSSRKEVTHIEFMMKLL